ncbi:MAG: hemerythrin domain-containing protein [Bryobacterales bacterium]|nr:hemerythrin domain-containing protein [Bryobacterales bacterium]
MPIVIGAKQESSFGDPVGLLTDCHRRIERFLGVLGRVCELAGGGPLTTEQRGALDTALRYFREAAPKHTADEEKTLFPRLRTLDSPAAKAILARVDELEAQHGVADESHAEIDRLGMAWLTAGNLTPEDAGRMASQIAALREMYKGHIAAEEREVFPVASAEFDQAARDAMGGEMAARRGQQWPAAPDSAAAIFAANR